uniref:Uncharacterized protein n=1 Tax=Arundo donax TaxID=35708 RepID=A0A0A9B0K5_ARUDO
MSPTLLSPSPLIRLLERGRQKTRLKT